ncbi:MAG: tail fiber domain-containing protein [Pyrinomonadaceae bacterium]
MKNLKYASSILSILFVVVCFQISALGQTADDKNRLATISGAGSSVRWDVAAPNAGGAVTIAAPDGRIFRREFKSGGAAEFTLSDLEGNRLPDGVYTYELRLSPVKDKLAAVRRRDDEPEDVRAARRPSALPNLVQSGSFSILNGAVVVPGSMVEGQRQAAKITMERPLSAVTASDAKNRSQLHHPLLIAKPDDVIPDDLIVQGSACVGLDCVDGEVFGFDTIRVKENNTRIQFDDTSAAGFPLNNWQIRANSSAAGGASFLAFVDQGAAGNSETGTIVFEVDAGAPANSMKVASTGKVGLRTATPVLDLHINTSDTPAHRLEQNNSGGFTAQTWDIAGNEANFFVRDVTGGSRLPFRIRPGAPTSSLDINAAGSVGIGTAAPNKSGVTRAITVNGSADAIYEWAIADVRKATMYHNNTALSITNNVNGALTLGTNNVERLRVEGGGNVGIATAAPTATLSVNGTANKPGGGAWDVFSDERLKNVKGRFNSGLQAVMQLQPIRYEYKRDNALGIKSEGEHVGFGAQALQKVIPEAVTRNANGYLQVNNDPVIWTMLNAIQEQQKQIEQLKGQIKQLRARSHRRR